MQFSSRNALLAYGAAIAAAVAPYVCFELVSRRRPENVPLLAIANQDGSADETAPNGYATINGLKMYYEIHGQGPPLVLLHGGCSTIETSFARILPRLAEKWRVIAVEQQGHGRTADIDRPMSYEQMADDTAALLEQLRIGQADLLGFSDGGTVALGVAIRHPDQVRRLVVIGTHYDKEGYYPEILEFRKTATVEDVPPELRDAYRRVAPVPEHWPQLVAKVARMGIEFAGWSKEQVESIAAPTLILLGDSDFVRPEHAVEMFRLHRVAQLAIAPGADHGLIEQDPELVLRWVDRFLLETSPGQKQSP